ncbi:MAG TPA: tRNA lysidine(34) synthetase TilS [Thermoanaerobaculia bacterium]|nr:tRNA lysidine(34) synthetase TilS [Thermoanaerobaculia bacterium]
MEPADAVARFLFENDIEPSHIVVAVSGGADSTALLLSLHELAAAGYSITAAHVNHHLRGAESDDDAAFVRHLASSLGIAITVADGPLERERVRSIGIEAAAREVRYSALESIRQRLGAGYIATGHQKNDQAETVLLRLITGSGVGRLAGIRPVSRRHILRPLLETTRAEIEAFLQVRNQTARVDRSNVDRRHLRNRIRHEILPLLEQLNPRIVDTLAETAKQAREQVGALDAELERIAATSITRRDDSTRFSLSSLPDDPWLLRHLIAREVQRLEPGARAPGAAGVRRLAEAFRTIRRETVTANLEIVRHDEAVELRRRPRAIGQFEVRLTPGEPSRIHSIDATVVVKRLPRLASSEPMSGEGGQYFQPAPGESIRELLVRNRRRGDRFSPLGLGAEKKLNELLIDRKIPRERRDRLPLLVCNGEIAWIAGVEVSERFKVTDRRREVWHVLVEYADG